MKRQRQQATIHRNHNLYNMRKTPKTDYQTRNIKNIININLRVNP